MTEQANSYCAGYLAVPIVESCHRHELFALLDPEEYRGRKWLVEKLNANEGFFTIALDMLESLGWIERNGDDVYRLVERSCSGVGDMGLTAMYAIEPARFIADTSYVLALNEKIAAAFSPTLSEQLAWRRLAQGSVRVLLLSILQEAGVETFGESLRLVDALHTDAILKLLAEFRWPFVENRELTASGQEVAQAPVIRMVASYRPLLYRVDDLLFGNAVGCEEASQLASSSYYGILRQTLSRECGLNSEQDVQDLRVSADRIAGEDGAQPETISLEILATDQPVHYLDREG
ncbi:MAG: hypothetical protein ABSB60_19290, partial [Terracidiphilus sp.]